MLHAVYDAMPDGVDADRILFEPIHNDGGWRLVFCHVVRIDFSC
jgi:hypothetical protein